MSSAAVPQAFLVNSRPAQGRLATAGAPLVILATADQRVIPTSALRAALQYGLLLLTAGLVGIAGAGRIPGFPGHRVPCRGPLHRLPAHHRRPVLVLDHLKGAHLTPRSAGSPHPVRSPAL